MSRASVLVTSLLLAVVLAPAGARARTENAAERPQALASVDYEQRLGNAVPRTARFLDEQGRSVTIGDYLGRHPIVLVPAYYHCPMLCTMVLDAVARSLRGVGATATDLDVVVVGFDPAETPAEASARKAALLKPADQPERWHLLTGEEADIRAVTDAIGFRYSWDAEHHQWAHPAGIVVVTPDGRVARYLFGIDYAPRDLRLALVEASAGRLGSIVDRLLLFCYEYDPASGAYGLVVMRTVRIAGAFTALAIVAFVVLALRREWRAMHGIPGDAR